MMIRLAAAAALALAPAAHAQTRTFDADIAVTDLGGGVYMLVGRGGNIGLSVGEDGAFMIDDQFAPLTPRIETAIASVAESGDVRFIVNTHYHGDHTGGNEAWSGRGATVFAHHNARERLMNPQISTLNGEVTPATTPGHWPSVTFADGATFHMNGQTVRVMHVPRAHTDGDAIVHFVEADVVHMGDVLFNGTFPYLDSNAGGTIDGYVNALDYALTLMDEDTQIIPGHGPLANRADVEASFEMLSAARNRIAALVRDGATRDETVDAAPLADFEIFGGGFITTTRFTELVYDDLAARLVDPAVDPNTDEEAP